MGEAQNNGLNKKAESREVYVWMCTFYGERSDLQYSRSKFSSENNIFDLSHSCGALCAMSKHSTPWRRISLFSAVSQRKSPKYEFRQQALLRILKNQSWQIARVGRTLSSNISESETHHSVHQLVGDLVWFVLSSWESESGSNVSC